MSYIIPYYYHSFFGYSILCGYNSKSSEIELLGKEDINNRNDLIEYINKIFGEKLSSHIDNNFYNILNNNKEQKVWEINLPNEFSRIYQNKDSDKSLFSQYYWVPKQQLYSCRFKNYEVELYSEGLIAKPYKISKNIFNTLYQVARDKDRRNNPLSVIKHNSKKKNINKETIVKKHRFSPRKPYKRKI